MEYLATKLVEVANQNKVPEQDGSLRQQVLDSVVGYIISNSLVGVCVIEHQKIRYANSRFLELSGYQENELQDKDPIAIVHKEDRELARRNLARALSTGSSHNCEYRIISKSNKIIWVIGDFVVSTTNATPTIMAFLMDISEYRAARESWRNTENRLLDIARNALELIWELDADGNYVFVNEAYKDIMGYEPEELIGRNVDDFWVLGDEETKNKWNSMVHSHQVIKNWVNNMAHKDGRIVTLETNGIPFFDSNGQFLGYRGTDRDITSELDSKRIIEQSEQRFRDLTESTSDVIWEVDVNQHYTYVNPKIGEVIGYGPEEVIGKTAAYFMTKEEAEKHTKQMAKIINSQGPFTKLENTMLHRDGHSIVLESSGIPFYNAGGVFLGYRGVARDITERKETEKNIMFYQWKLRSLASELSLAEERERRRIAKEVHDRLGQTLAICSMRLGTLIQDNSTNGLNESIKDSIIELNSIIKKLIGEARSLAFELSSPLLYEVGLEAALERLIQDVSVQNGLAFQFLGDKQSKPLDDDVKVLLFQGVREVLVNVIKHARATKINMRICQEKNNILVSITDNGIGFIHDRRHIDGGFGLFSISERLHNVGGHVEVKSEIGKGTSVILVAPLRCSSKTAGQLT